MNLKEQEYICVLARCGSITKAASQLFISQPALSVYINNVEKALGVELFYRDGKCLRLTYAGELYVQKAEEMLRMRRDFQREINDIAKGTKGRLRVGVQMRRSPYMVVDSLLKFSEEFPHIDLRFFDWENDMLNRMFEEGQLDLLIHNNPVEAASVVNEVLLRENILLAVTRTDPIVTQGKWIPGNSYPWLDLKLVESQVIILPSPQQSLRKDCDRLLNDAGVKTQKVIVIRNLETGMQMAAHGMGVAFTRESYAVRFHYIKRPMFFTVGNPVAEKPLYAIYRKEREKIPELLRLIEIIRDVVTNGIAHNGQ